MIEIIYTQLLVVSRSPLSAVSMFQVGGTPFWTQAGGFSENIPRVVGQGWVAMIPMIPG